MFCLYYAMLRKFYVQISVLKDIMSHALRAVTIFRFLGVGVDEDWA